MAEPKTGAPVAKGVSSQASQDGRFVVLTFDCDSGPVRVGVPLPAVGQVVGHLAGMGAMIAKKPGAPAPQKDSISAVPIAADAVALQAGRSAEEALITFRSGVMDLVFAVPMGLIRTAAEKLLRNPAPKAESETKH